MFPDGATRAHRIRFLRRFALSVTPSPPPLALPLYHARAGLGIVRFFSKYATFTGRASRSEFWWAVVFVAVLWTVPPFFLTSAATGDASWRSTHGGSGSPPHVPGTVNLYVAAAVVAIGLFLALTLPLIALSWRRLHDANLPGPLWFLGLVPGVGGIALLVLLVRPSRPEGARFDAPWATSSLIAWTPPPATVPTRPMPPTA